MTVKVALAPESVLLPCLSRLRLVHCRNHQCAEQDDIAVRVEGIKNTDKFVGGMLLTTQLFYFPHKGLTVMKLSENRRFQRRLEAQRELTRKRQTVTPEVKSLLHRLLGMVIIGIITKALFSRSQNRRR